jgi:hypothetical protein
MCIVSYGRSSGFCCFVCKRAIHRDHTRVPGNSPFQESLVFGKVEYECDPMVAEVDGHGWQTICYSCADRGFPKRKLPRLSDPSLGALREQKLKAFKGHSRDDEACFCERLRERTGQETGELVEAG